MYIKDILSLYSTSGEADKDYRYLKTLIDIELIPKKDNVSSLDYLSEVFMCCLEQCKFLIPYFHEPLLEDYNMLGILFKNCLHVSKITLDNIRLGSSFVPLTDIVNRFSYYYILDESMFSPVKAKTGENFQKYRYDIHGSIANYTETLRVTKNGLEEEVSSLLNMKYPYLSLLDLNFSTYLIEKSAKKVGKALRLKKLIKNHFDELISAQNRLIKYKSNDPKRSQEEAYCAKKARTLLTEICNFIDIYRTFFSSTEIYDLDLNRKQMNDLLLAPDFLSSTLKQTLLLAPDLICRFFITKAQNHECNNLQAAKYISIPFARDYLVDYFRDDEGQINEYEMKDFFTIYVPFLSRLFFFTLLSNERCTFDESYEKNSNLNKILSTVLSECHSLSFSQAHFIPIVNDILKTKNRTPFLVDADIDSIPTQSIKPYYYKDAKEIYYDIFNKDISKSNDVSSKTVIVELYKYSQSSILKPKYTDAMYQQYLLDIAEFISEYMFSVPTTLIPPLRKITFEMDHYDDYCKALHIYRPAYENEKALLQSFYASKMLTLDEVCRDICITQGDLKTLLDDGIIIGLKCGEEILVTPKALTEYIQKQPLEKQLELLKLSKESVS